MRFQITYGPADYQTEYRNSLAAATERCEALAKQGFTVELRNPDTGFLISTYQPR